MEDGFGQFRLDPYADLLEYPSVERWLRFKALRTKHTYLQTMRIFLKFSRPELQAQTPDDLVKWAKSQPDTLLIQDIVEKFAETRPGPSQTGAIMTLRSFLKRNGVTGLPSMGGQPVQRAFHEGYTRPQLQAVLLLLRDKLKKAYVMVAKDSGLRCQDVLSLRYKHISPELEKQEFPHIFLGPEHYNRRKASGRTFLGPNSTTLIKTLIREGRVETDPEKRLFPFSYNAIVTSLRLARDKASLDKTFQPNHALRKFFENALDRVGMDKDKKMQIEGHSIGVKRFYASREIEQLRKLYAAAYPYLDLSVSQGESDLVVEKLQESLREQQKKIDSLESQVGDYRGLETNYRRLQQQLRSEREAELTHLRESLTFDVKGMVKEDVKRIMADKNWLPDLLGTLMITPEIGPEIQAAARTQRERLLAHATSRKHLSNTRHVAENRAR